MATTYDLPSLSDSSQSLFSLSTAGRPKIRMACSCSAAIRQQLLLPTKRASPISPSQSHAVVISFLPENSNSISFVNLTRRKSSLLVKSSPANNPGISLRDDGEGVSLGTMKLPLDTDIPRFETLLFQWANSLCQGANLPLPLPLKVDKIQGGVRLGFVTIEDGETQVPVYIDCLVFPGSGDSGPFFRAVRNGGKKDVAPPGEPRIMKSLLAALQKSVEIARV